MKQPAAPRRTFWRELTMRMPRDWERSDGFRRGYVHGFTEGTLPGFDRDEAGFEEGHFIGMRDRAHERALATGHSAIDPRRVRGGERMLTRKTLRRVMAARDAETDPQLCREVHEYLDGRPTPKKWAKQ